ncbi:MAG: hypothetical protein HC923_00450 [Myxococcales bacterium]|nr:hypothetical protein [Myxococcales bacterium]
MSPVAGATLVVSAIPPDAVPPERILGDWVDYGSAPLVIDLAYDLEGVTPLVRDARRAGLEAEDGKRLLVEQAALSFEFWTGGNRDRVRAAMAREVGVRG